jgi:hypothetical protein
MPKRIKQPWEKWVEVTKPMYLRRMRGWPAAEMRKYWEEGMSPLEAYDEAIQRRLTSDATSDAGEKK